MVLPVTTVLLLFFFSLVMYVSAGAQTFGAADVKVVTLSIDDEKQVVPTRAKTVEDLLERLEIETRDSDIIEPSVDVQLEQDFRINIYTSRAVLIVDGEDTDYIETAEPQPRNVAEEAGIDFHPEDVVKRDTSEPIDAIDALHEGVISERIVIRRATPVQLNLFGAEYELRTHAETVEELLIERGVNVDNVSVLPDLNELLTDNEAIFVTDPDKDIVMEEEEIPPPEEVVEDYELDWGERQVRDEGRVGRRVIVYEIAEDGSRSTLQNVVVSEPVTQTVAEGRRLAGTSNPSENVRIGEEIAADRGWSSDEWLCLYNLWQRESRWDSTANNPSSGAYGIPQALPGNKMATVGSDWRTNPETQITWGLNYIEGRYNSPCAAYSFFLDSNWY